MQKKANKNKLLNIEIKFFNIYLYSKIGKSIGNRESNIETRQGEKKYASKSSTHKAGRKKLKIF